MELIDNGPASLDELNLMISKVFNIIMRYCQYCEICVTLWKSST